MDSMDKYLISKNNGTLQLPYEAYVSLLEKRDEARRVMQVKSEVLADLQHYLENGTVRSDSEGENPVSTSEAAVEAPDPEADEEMPEKVSIEFSAEDELMDDAEGESPEKSASNRAAPQQGTPPIKKEIAEHFNRHDESGRIFNVFKQYYTCLNEACGGTVRVTMKDGVCSLLNYDEWEEFGFVDIFEGNLRFAVDPRYTDALSSLDFCEVPRLLSSRRNLICIQVEDLNKTMLSVLARAFEEVGLAAG